MKITIAAETANELEESVKALINDGWFPAGEVTFNNDLERLRFSQEVEKAKEAVKELL